MNKSVSTNLTKFLTILQFFKFDWKFFNLIFNLRISINSIFYDVQYTDMSKLNFSSGSTFANYINLMVLFVIVGLIILLLKLFKRLSSKDDIHNAIVYLNKVVNVSIFISILKLAIGFIFLNWFSELMNQITLSSSEGDVFSYTLTDLLIIFIFWIIISQQKSKEN